ncbi:hypothetical protein TYRP_023349, partial [Tyrophagus putrescentiae]
STFCVLCKSQEIDVGQLIPPGYNPNFLPASYNETVNVVVSLYVNEIFGVTDSSQSFQTDVFLLQEWKDHRLTNQSLVLTQPYAINQIWKPDLYFVNSRDVKQINSLETVEKMTIDKKGNIAYMLRLSATFKCQMNLINYPHDYHNCPIKMSSIKYSPNELQFSWGDFDVKDNVEYPMFKIRSWFTARCEKKDQLLTNSCLSGTIKIVRRLSYYLIRYYFLSFLTVAICALGPYYPVNAWPLRANITVSPLLALITQDMSINNEIGVSYTVSIHIWMMFLQGFVYLAILEFAVAVAIAHLAVDKKNWKIKNEKIKTDQISTVTPFAPAKLPGYYFGNDSFFTSFGKIMDKFLYKIYGEVDFTREPYSRNKVDYVWRIFFPFVLLIYILDKIREEVQHINAQLRIFYDERFSNENDDVKKAWIINTSKTLKNDFEETMSKLRVMQQNFIQTHKSKIFDLERQIDPSNPSNLNVQEKIELYRNSMSRCETDIHLNNQKLEQLRMHLSNGSFDNLQNYDTVDISPRVTAIHPVPIDAVGTLNRKQHLLLVVIAATTLMLIVTNSIDSSVINSLSKVEYMQIWPNEKLIQYCSRLSITFICHMEFANFPFDEHYCNFELESFEKTAQQLDIRIVFVGGVKGNAKFRIRNTYTGHCPTFLMVVMGMANQYLPTNAWPARIILTASVLLTLITVSLQGYNESPSNDVTSMEYAFALSWQYLIQDKKYALASSKPDYTRTIVPKNYDAQMKPGKDTLNISISLYVNDLIGAVDKDQTIQLDIILIEQWTDDRLNLSAIDQNQNFIVTTPSIIKKFWLPDLYFVNGLSATVVNAFQAVQKLTVTSNGLITYAQRINTMLSCPMNLQNFPHDYQYCRIKISTIIYNQKEIRLLWNKFEAYPGEYPIFKIRYWYTADCERWENPIPILFTYVSYSGNNTSPGVYYVTSMHWYLMWLQGIVYLGIVEYAVAISYAHFIADKKYYAKLLEQANNNSPNGTTVPVPEEKYLRGYYFGSDGWYAKCGAFFDKFCHFFFGPVDFQQDPYTRNKIDYVCRVLFVFFYLFYIFLYVMITVLYWAGNYN